MARLAEDDLNRARKLLAALERAGSRLRHAAAGSAVAEFTGIQGDLASLVPRFLDELEAVTRERDDARRERDEALEIATRAPGRRK